MKWIDFLPFIPLFTVLFISTIPLIVYICLKMRFIKSLQVHPHISHISHISHYPISHISQYPISQTNYIETVVVREIEDEEIIQNIQVATAIP